MKVSITRSTWLITLPFIGVLLGCSPNNDSLRRAIDHYYTTEQAHDWSNLYSLRTKSVRDSYNKSYFVREMENESKGWNLKQWNIKTIKHESSDKVNVKIEFHEKLNMKAAKSIGVPSAKDKGIQTTEWTTWLRENGQWKCQSCGGRFHFALNSE